VPDKNILNIAAKVKLVPTKHIIITLGPCYNRPCQRWAIGRVAITHPLIISDFMRTPFKRR